MKASKTILMALVLAICPALPMAAIKAGIFTTSPELPPNGYYVTSQDMFATYVGLSLEIVLQDVMYIPITDSVIRDYVGTDEIMQFNSILTGNAFIDVGSGPTGPVAFSMTGPSSMVAYGKDTVLGEWSSEIIEMTLEGDLGGMPVYLRESPTHPSVGMTSVADVGGGLYWIDSFFDVFTELSVDGGATWIAAASSVRIQLVPVPSPFILGSIGLGFAGLRLRKKT